MATAKGVKKRLLRLKCHVKPDHLVPIRGDRRIVVDLADAGGLQLAVWGGRRAQPCALDIWHHMLGIQDWNLIVDAGANYGEFSVPAGVGRAQWVIAVEPNPAVVARLTRSLEMNGASAQVISAFLGQQGQLSDLVVSGNSRLGRMGSADSDVRLSVPVLALDSVSEPHLPDGGSLLMKIDVEGAEVDVIRGARATLRRAARSALLVEAIHTADDLLRQELDGFDTWGVDQTTGEIRRLDRSDATPDSVGLDARDLLFTSGFSVDQVCRKSQRSEVRY